MRWTKIDEIQSNNFTAPDNTVHENLRNVEPVSYVRQFKTVSGSYMLPYKGISGDDELVRKSNSAKSTGPVHTYVKTDKNANFKWGVRHYVGNKYAR